VDLVFGVDFTLLGRGIRGAVWFGFEGKSHPNRKIKNYAVWFGLIWLTLKIKSKPNQTNAVWIGLCGFFRDNLIFFPTLKLSYEAKIQHICFIVLNFINHYNFIFILQCFQQHKLNQ